MPHHLSFRFAMLSALGLALLTGAGKQEDGSRWWSYVSFLADDKLEGRNTGSEGHRKAAQWVATQFERAGLKAAGTQGYIQPVQFDTRRIVEKDSSLALVRNGKAEALVLGDDATLGMRVNPAESVDAPLVFAGYGLTVPEMQYDDLKGLDLRGKVAVFILGGPSNIPGPLRSHFQSAPERNRFLARAGVIGTIVLQNPRT